MKVKPMLDSSAPREKNLEMIFDEAKGMAAAKERTRFGRAERGVFHPLDRDESDEALSALLRILDLSIGVLLTADDLAEAKRLAASFANPI